MVLAIAGSDSGGGAGIQADLKAIAACGAHGTTAITAVTSQNTRGVTAVHMVPLEHIRSQIAAVFDDYEVAAVKIGMLGNRETAELVAEEMAARKPRQLVLDPVMIATTGARLLDEKAMDIMIRRLIPLADAVTPNLPEAEALLGMRISKPADAATAGARLREMGARTVLLTGGHGQGREIVDHFFDEDGELGLRHSRLRVTGHGTGCALASALAAGLATGLEPRVAARRAMMYVHQGLDSGYQPGASDLTVLG
ncbi:MAG TPA: bifunctional hydroxymethylpyrimidine kinase/phosphomethylpyrimidine kinase [Rhodanobacteraceae bacterium]|nr:bifunctional hydroxymethylpyrimidine kinase/phosphomethylpyrimidine kinase [Rhodanobacteraceae bacterium]